MICFICYEQIPKEKEIAIEYAALSGNSLPLKYKYFHCSCFEECGLVIDGLKNNPKANISCPWCNINYSYSPGMRGCVQIMIGMIGWKVISRPCSTCWNKYGISLE